MKKLPKIYKKEEIHPMDNNRKVYHITEEILEENDIGEQLDSIFKGYRHSYNTKVFIKTKKRTYETYLVSRTKKMIITIENDGIPINEILYIKRIEK